MKRVWAVLTIIGLLILAVSIFVISPSPDTPYTYSGKETFQTEHQYTQFKETVASDEITITEMVALSSSPPIVVQFRVDSPQGVNFPYGHKSRLPSSDLFSILCALGFALPLLGAGLFFFNRMATSE